MSPSESQLTPQGKSALKLIRALRRLPDNAATRAAENSATKNLTVPDVRIIALILADEEAANE